MKKIIICLLALLFGLECFSQSNARVMSTAGAVLIDARTILRDNSALIKLVNYDIQNKLSSMDSLRIIDSILVSQNSSKEIIIPEIEIGFSIPMVIKILGYPLEEIVLPTNNKQKWIYKDIYVYFDNGVVVMIQKHK